MHNDALARLASCLVLAGAELLLAVIMCLARCLALVARPLAAYVERQQEQGWASASDD